MKFARFTIESDSMPRTGIFREGRWYEIEGDMFGDEWITTKRWFTEQEIRLLPPIIPNEIIGIGANYMKDESERVPSLGQPILFFKPKSTVIGTGEAILLPEVDRSVKFESELAVVIGKETKNITEEQAYDHIFGYTIANDVTAPEYFHPGGHWTVGKSFDTFCPLGPVIETDLDLNHTLVEAYVNGVQKQHGRIQLMITSIPKLIAYLSSFMSLMPGDVILTGSPAGADMVGEGDVVTCKIDGIGMIQNRIMSAIR